MTDRGQRSSEGALNDLRVVVAAVAVGLMAAGCGVTESSKCAGVTCAPVDQCHGRGECDASTGSCSQPPLPDGTACNDGSSMTFFDACQAGACVGVPAVAPVITGTTPASPNATSATPTFAGTAQVPPAGVTSRAQLYRDDGCRSQVRDAAAAVTDGRFTIALPAAAAVALNTASAFTVRVTDSAFNASPCSAPFTYTYAKKGVTPTPVGLSAVMTIRIPDGPAAEERGKAGDQKQRTVEEKVVEVPVPRVAERQRAEPARPAPPPPRAPEPREPERPRREAPPAAPAPVPAPVATPAPAPAAAPSVQDAPVYAGDGFRKPVTAEPGCVPRSIRVTSEMLDQITGPIVVKFAVDREGTPGRFEVLTGGTDPRVAGAIERAVQECQWIAGADAQGRLTSAWVIMPLRFSSR